VPVLAKYFLQQSARELNVETKRLTEAALKNLQAQDWPGNVRQLQNVCHWLTVMSPSLHIEVNDLPGELRAESAVHTSQSWINALEREAEMLLNRGESGIIDDLTRQFEKALIQRALAHTGGRRIEAAHLLGLGRNTLTRKIQELKLDEEKA
jgi:two-component system, NtrC family, nitrogen regulation response regulator GlnG